MFRDGPYRRARRVWNRIWGNDYVETVEVGEARARFYIEDGADERQAYDNSRLEQPILRDAISSVDDDDVFADVGANIGLFSCLVGSSAATVLAFEPNQPVFERLRKNLELNDVRSEPRQVALSNTTGTTEFLVPDSPTSSGAAAIEKPNHRQTKRLRGYGEYHREEVETVTGDRLFHHGEFPTPDVLKIDVEGAEMSVLKGMEETLSDSQVRTVYCEVHRFIDDFGHNQDEVDEFLERHGFELERLAESSQGDYTLRARR